MNWWRRLGLFVASFAVVLVAARAHATCPTLNSSASCFDISAPTVLALDIDREPPVLVRVNFDREDGQGHVQTTWDPAEGAGLRRRVLLPSKNSTVKWCVSVAADQTPIVVKGTSVKTNAGQNNTITTQFNGELRATYRFAPFSGSGSSWSAAGKYETESSTAGDESLILLDRHPTKVTLQAINDCAAPKIDEVASGLASTSAAGAGPRAFEDTLAAAGTDVLQLLAEIVMDRAKSKAFDLVRSMLLDGCDKLTWPTNSWGLSGRILPQTCTAIEHIAIADVASAGQVLEKALASDVASALATVISSQLAGNASFQPLVKTVGQMAVDAFASHKIDKMQSQLLVSQLVTAVGKSSSSEVACALQLTLAAVAACHSTAACDARMIEGILANPQEYFTANNTSACSSVANVGSAWIDSHWPHARQFAATVLRVIEAPQSVSEKDVLRDASALTFDALGLAMGCNVSPAPQPCVYVSAAREIFNDALAGDTKAVIVAAANALSVTLKGDEQKSAAFKKLTALVSAVASYATAFPVKPDGTIDDKQMQANREARKKAIENLMDAATDRSQRGGDWVVSLGALAGFNMGAQYSQVSLQSGASTDHFMPPQLSLALGFAAQRLPKSKFGVGFHAQVTLIDLAQYVSYTNNGQVSEPRADSFLTIGGQIGFLFGSSSSAFFLGFDGRYAPTAFSDPVTGTKGNIALGFLSLAYYVPIFDFN